LTRFRVAADSLPLLPDAKASERRDLHGFTLGKGIGYFVQYGLDEGRGFVARKPNFLIDGLAEIGARNGLT
jgi:hypothetical protein